MNRYMEERNEQIYGGEKWIDIQRRKKNRYMEREMNRYIEEKNEYIYGGEKWIDIWRREMNRYMEERNE